jgi:hypothetical protein
MDNDQKMLPSTLSKSTELTTNNQKSTELAKRQSSGDIVRAKSNITRAKSNVTPAKPNINPLNNGGGGGGGGGGNGNRGTGGGNDGTTVEIFLSNSSYNSGSGYSSAQSYSQSQYSSSESFCFQQPNMNSQNYASSRAYSHQQQQPSVTEKYVREQQNTSRNNYGSDASDRGPHHSKSPETEQVHDVKEQKEMLSSLGIIILAIIVLQLALGLTNALFGLIAQVSSSPLVLIIFLIAGLFLLLKHDRSQLNKNGTARENLKAIQARLLEYTLSKFKILALRSNDNMLVRSKTGHNNQLL